MWPKKWKILYRDTISSIMYTSNVIRLWYHCIRLHGDIVVLSKGVAIYDNISALLGPCISNMLRSHYRKPPANTLSTWLPVESRSKRGRRVLHHTDMEKFLGNLSRERRALAIG